MLRKISLISIAIIGCLLCIYNLCKVENTNSVQWGINNKGQKINGSVGVNDVDINYIEESDNIDICKVAIIDSGINFSDVRIADKILLNDKDIYGDGIDNDNNGYIDDYYGWDFGGNQCVSKKSNNKHATELALIICGSEKYIGVSTNARLINIKIDEEHINEENLVDAIKYAKDRGASIVNCSFTLATYSEAVYNAILESEMLFICAAGNDNLELCEYPAAYKLDNVISVAGIDNKGLISAFSNYGKTVDIAAPGEGIAMLSENDELYYVQGTSYATAFVTGVAARVYGYSLDSDPKYIKEILLLNANKIIQLKDSVNSEGMIDMEKSINAFRVK